MTPCQETREVIEEYRRGELAPEARVRVGAHLGQCPPCQRLMEHESALAAMVRGLGRTPTPPGLARRIRRLAGPRRGPRAWLGRPWVAAAAAAVVVALGLSPWLQFRTAPQDPVELLLQSGVTEHRRLLLQLQDLGTEVADPASAFARVRTRTDVELPWVFAGDDEYRLLAARPTVIGNRKAAAVALRDPGAAITTYFALPGKDLPMPATQRVQIEQYKPHMRQLGGFGVIYWKQGDLAYLMVSDLPESRFRELFLKMRKAL